MSLFDQQEAEDNNQITGDTRSYMLKAGKWMRFLAIIGFVFMGLMVIVVFLIPSFISNVAGNGLDMPGTAMLSGVLLIPMLIGIALVIFPNIFLYQSAINFIKYAKDSEAYHIETGFKKLSAMYTYLGVLVIIYLAFFVLAFAFAGVFG